MWLTQSAAPLVCSMLRGTEPDLDIEQSPKTSERTKLLGSSSPRPSLILDRPGMHIKIPSSNFAAYSAHGHALAPPAHTPFAISNLDIESQDSSSPLSPPLSCGPATPSLPSRSPTGCDRPPTRNGQSPSTAPHGHSSIFPELREAARYLLHTLTSPARRAALYGSCAMALHLLSMICVIWFAVSWLRTYSFSVARTDLITVLRYMLLVAAPFALWCLPALCALSALLSWPHAADPDADGAHLHSSANSSPISFPVPRRSGCFDADPAADTYAVAAASQDLLHEAATPRFGFTIFTDPQAVTDGGAASPHTPPRRPSPPPPPLTPTAFATACLETVAKTCSGRPPSDLRRPLLPATHKPRPRAAPRLTCGAGSCGPRTFAILSVWLRHEFYLAMLCALAGYGTLAVALFDRDVLSRVADAVIVMYPTAALQTMAWDGSVIMFCLYSMLLTCGCLCALAAAWFGAVTKRAPSRSTD